MVRLVEVLSGALLGIAVLVVGLVAWEVHSEDKAGSMNGEAPNLAAQAVRFLVGLHVNGKSAR